VALQVRVSSL
jgi:hypothetical protein